MEHTWRNTGVVQTLRQYSVIKWPTILSGLNKPQSEKWTNWDRKPAFLALCWGGWANVWCERGLDVVSWWNFSRALRSPSLRFCLEGWCLHPALQAFRRMCLPLEATPAPRNHCVWGEKMEKCGWKERDGIKWCALIFLDFCHIPNEGIGWLDGLPSSPL